MPDALKKHPFYLLLFPVFFVLHGHVLHFEKLYARPALGQAVLYCLLAMAITLIFYFFFRERRKAAVVTLTFLFFYFFFGNILHFLKNSGLDLFSKYSVILPVILLLVISLVIYLRRTSRKLLRVTAYLNVLILLLIGIDIATLAGNKTSRKPNLPALSLEQSCDTCTTPDIYLIVLDEYAGAEELQEVMSFDNSRFLNSLEDRGFHIIRRSRSNYTSTVQSMASMLNMDYLRGLSSKTTDATVDLAACEDLISDNHFTRFLTQYDYEFFNYSYFNLAQKKKQFTSPVFFPPKRDIVNFQTLPYRLNRDIGYKLPGLSRLLGNDTRKIKSTNREIDSLTRIQSGKTVNKPRFVYTHMLMPHGPFFYDSLGRETDYNNSKDIGHNGYLQYLVYTNKKMLELVDHILTTSKKSPVIFLLSDHGLRLPGEPAAKMYDCMTLNTIHLPGRNYAGFYEGLSHINLFRIFLNTQFGQQLPLLKDSCSLTPQ